jgi:very-short-patch-repair endonuclease
MLKGFGRRFREKKVGKYWVDIVLLADEKKIAIEYDGWHYHKNRLDKDRIKRAFLRDQGYLTLRIKAGQDVPTLEQLELAISRLLDSNAARRWIEITLAGWGE